MSYKIENIGQYTIVTEYIVSGPEVANTIPIYEELTLLTEGKVRDGVLSLRRNDSITSRRLRSDVSNYRTFPSKDMYDGSLVLYSEAQLIEWVRDNTGVNTLYPHTHVEADITDLKAYLLDITGENLDDLANITITTAAKGDVLVYNGTAWVDLTVGADGTIIVADSAEVTGVKWAVVGGDYQIKTGAYTAIPTDDIIECSGTFTVTLYTAVGNTNKRITIKNAGTGLITEEGDGTETLEDELTQALPSGDSHTWVSNGTNWLII